MLKAFFGVCCLGPTVGLLVCRFHCVVKVVPVGGTNDILSVYSKARRPILYSEMLMGGAYEMLVSAGTKNVT